MFHVKHPPILTITLPDACPPSWNRFYAGMHWAERKRIADEAHTLIRCYLPFNWQPITVPVSIRYDAYQVRPQDADNIASKLYTDGLVRAGVLAGDDWRHVQAVTTATHKASANSLVITILPT